MATTEKSLLKYESTGYFSKLIIDYLQSDEKLQAFYSTAPTLENFEHAIAIKAKQKINRPLLIEVLREQYIKSNLEFPQQLNNLLSQPTTFTVTTGHQLCLFTGPLYFLYKILSTINLCEQLAKKYPANNFVPVYWMASEDHDFAEINHFHLFGKSIEWNPENKAATAVGKLSTDSLKTIFDEVKVLFGSSENAQELTTIFENSYLNNATLTDATRFLVHQLFGKYNLVILDADDKRLKQEFLPVISDDIFKRENFVSVTNSIHQLEKLGYKAQVNPREINCFYMNKTMRERLLYEDGKYRVNNSSIIFTEDELKNELHEFPERFSPNVVLRPLYQEVILPNLAYIGGGGELAYWLQYKAMFDAHNIQFPILLLRNSALLVEASAMEKWKKFGFMEADLFLTTDVLIKKFMDMQSDGSSSLASEQNELKALYSQLIEKVQKKEQTLKATAEAELQKALVGLTNLEAKLLKAEKQKQETTLNQIKKLKDKLFPEGELQERYENFSAFYLKYGKELIPFLKENLNPMQTDFALLTIA